MQKFTVSFLGRDCPGVVSTVSGLLSAAGCNIFAATQSLLLGEFAGIFMVSVDDALTQEALQGELQQGLAKAGMDLSLIVRPTHEEEWGKSKRCEPFVVSADGTDGEGQIAKISRVFTRHGVNVESLRAFLGEGGANHALFVFEIMVPDSVDLGRLRRELVCEGQSLGLRVSVQHRDIFEAVHRIGSF
ncbi:MAG: amino acid-binding protein [Desulfovibrionaceae bacterium]|nr:amino acid-binding protein [Desulfovibrionaceae bacterium]